MSHKQLLAQAFAPVVAVKQSIVAVQEIEADVTGEYFEAKKELDEHEMAIGEAEGVAVGIESLISEVETVQMNGSMDSTSARFLQAATNAVMAPFGGAGVIELAGVESFDEDGGSLAAVTFSLETLKESLGKVWDTIVTFIKGLGKTISKFYQQHLALVGRVNKRATALKGEDLKGEPKEKELEMGSSLQALSTDGKVSTDLSVSMKMVADALKAGDLSDEAKAYAEAIAEGVKDPVKADDAIKASTEFFDDIAKAYGATDEVKGDKRFGENAVVRSKTTLPGDKAVFLVTTPATDTKGAKLVSFGIQSTVTDVKKVAKDEKIAALDAKGITEVAQEIESITALIIGAKVSDKEGEAMRQALIALGDELSKDVEGLKGKIELKVALTIFRSLASKMHKPKMDVMNALVSSANAALNVAIKSKANLEEAGKADDKKDDDKKADDKKADEEK